jgi:hypothetical protein
MSLSFQNNIKDIQKFEDYINNLLLQYALNSNLTPSSNLNLSSSKDDSTNIVNLNFSSELTSEQYAIITQAISTYIEPPTDENLYRTTPYILNNICVKSTDFRTINNFLYSGTLYNEKLAKIKVSGRINTTNSNAYYSLKVIDITNNKIMGSNSFYNTEFAYGTIPLSNIPSSLATIEIQGQKGYYGDHFEINGIQLVYIFR